MGALIALAIIGAWLGSLAVTLRLEFDSLSLGAIGGLVLLRTFLTTGLFISAHDAMHGALAPGASRLNDGIGRVASILYAFFSFDKLRSAHFEHHRTPGVPSSDPDFHDGLHPGFVRWYARFIGHYFTFGQWMAFAVLFNLLEHGLGVSLGNLLAFWVAPALLSTLQLFYFGTYEPHRSPSGDGDPHHARSTPYPPWLSFLTCYHFGYHREHHEWPSTPWWRLPEVRGRAQPIDFSSSPTRST